MTSDTPLSDIRAALAHMIDAVDAIPIVIPADPHRVTAVGIKRELRALIAAMGGVP